MKIRKIAALAVTIIMTVMSMIIIPSAETISPEDFSTFVSFNGYTIDTLPVYDAEDCQSIMDYVYHMYQAGQTNGFKPCYLALFSLKTAYTGISSDDRYAYGVVCCPPSSLPVLGYKQTISSIDGQMVYYEELIMPEGAASNVRVYFMTQNRGFSTYTELQYANVQNGQKLNGTDAFYAWNYSSTSLNTMINGSEGKYIQAKTFYRVSASTLNSSAIDLGYRSLWYYIPTEFHPVVQDVILGAKVDYFNPVQANWFTLCSGMVSVDRNTNQVGEEIVRDEVIVETWNPDNPSLVDLTSYSKYTDMAIGIYGGTYFTPPDPVDPDDPDNPGTGGSTTGSTSVYLQGYNAGRDSILNNLDVWGLATSVEVEQAYNNGIQAVQQNPRNYSLYSETAYEAALDEGYADGVAEVRNHPNTYNLYTQAQYNTYGDQRYNDGLISSGEISQVSLDIPKIILAVPTGFRNLLVHSFDVDFFGINIGGLLLFALGLTIIIYVIKKLKG